MDYSNVYIMSSFILRGIILDKKFDKNVVDMLEVWLKQLIVFYDSKNDILNHISLENHTLNCLLLLKKVKNIKIYSLEEIISDKTCDLFKKIKKIPEKDIKDYDKTKRLKKDGEIYTLDENGDYYLSVGGLCCDQSKSIDLVLDNDNTILYFQHELGHIDQGFEYPSDFPFFGDVSKLFYEGDAEYQKYLIDKYLPQYRINSNTFSYNAYYQLYTVFMLIFPKDKHEYWKYHEHIDATELFINTFDIILDSEEEREDYAVLLAIITIIAASYNEKNSKEIFEESVKECYKRCTKKVNNENKSIADFLENEKENNKKWQDKYISLLHDMENMEKQIENTDLLKQEYLNLIREEKEYISSEPLELQDKLLKDLEGYTIKDYKLQVIEDIDVCKQNLSNIMKESTPKDILGEDGYKKYNYYKFGAVLSIQIQQMLSSKLTNEELFLIFLEKVKQILVKKGDQNLEEKLDFIEPLIKAHEESRKV